MSQKQVQGILIILMKSASQTLVTLPHLGFV